ncbi:MAG: glycosyltransferase family 4 protein [Chloroflexi bacterium]|nr:glycosyltransferase family 4 protein [Chloroflexota bacterium]
MTAPKSILIICPFFRPNVGGVEAHLDKLTRHLAQNNYNVQVITYQPLTTRTKGLPLEKSPNLVIHRVPWFGQGLFHRLEPFFPLVFAYLFPGLFLYSLYFYLSHHKEIDVIHAHGFVAAAITRVLTTIHRKRTVLSTHAVYDLGQRKVLAAIIAWLLSPFDFILAVGEPSRQELLQIGLPEERMAIHPNWIDLELFAPLDKAESRASLGFKQDDFIALFLGRLIAKKGVLLLLEAASQVNSPLTFVFVGDGPLAATLQERSLKQPNVVFRGRIPDDAQHTIVEYYSAADVCLLPSQYEEGFATVVLESIACGTPVIAANRGCLPYFIDPSVGRLIEPTVANIVATLDYYYQHREELERLRINCRDYALAHFSERNIEVIERSYD